MVEAGSKDPALHSIAPAALYDSPRWSLQSTDEQLALVDHFWRQIVMQLDEEFLVLNHFPAP